MAEQERLKKLNTSPDSKGSYVLYWMQCSQRAEFNPALDYSIDRANELGLPVLCLFGLDPTYPGANFRHYRFMVQGLTETAERLSRRGIQLVYRTESPATAAVALSRDASLVVCDRGYLRNHVRTRVEIAERITCPLIQVEGDVVVPVDEAYPKEAWSAAVLRPKISRLMDRYLQRPQTREVLKDSLGLHTDAESTWDVDYVLKGLQCIDDLPKVAMKGGISHAESRLSGFLKDRLPRYGMERNSPSDELYSGMSPYLHFGQISPVQLALSVRTAREVPAESKDAYLEELIVRRELSMNFARYNQRYDSYDALPEWALKTLDDHCGDKRPVMYDLDELESSASHDPYWNAAMNEMRRTGFMHNYMRMYWGKKILEWTESPREAFERTIYLNDKYFLDGRDPNSYAGVAWCYGKHDRGWKERPVFGKVRYMNSAGLERKFDMSGYLQKNRYPEA